MRSVPPHSHTVTLYTEARAGLACLPADYALLVVFCKKKITQRMMTKTVMGIMSMSVRIYEIITSVHFQTKQD